MGYTFLGLMLLCGALLFTVAHYTFDRVKKLEQRLELLSSSLTDSLKADDNASKNETEQQVAEEQIEKVVARLDIGKMDLSSSADLLLSKLSKQVSFVSAIMYVKSEEEYVPLAKYAFYSDTDIKGFKLGEGLNGQVVKDGMSIVIDAIPENYVRIVSGLGNSSPKAIMLAPVVANGGAVALLELAFLKTPSSFERELVNAVAGAMANSIPSLQEV